MNDFIGKPITAGCVVIYPVRRGSDMWLTQMTVTQVGEDGLKGYNKLGRRITVKNVTNVVVVKDA